MSWGPKNVSNGERFHLDFAKVIRLALSALHDLNVTSETLKSECVPLFRFLEKWRDRENTPRGRGEKFGLSEEYAERVYMVLDKAQDRYATRENKWNVPRGATPEVQVTYVQTVLIECLRLHHFVELQTAFVNDAEVLCHLSVNVAPVDPTLLERIIARRKALLNFLEHAAGELEKLPTDSMMPDFHRP